MTVYIGSRVKFRTRYGQPLGAVAVHLIADTKKALLTVAAYLGLGMDDYHETHFHVEGAERYRRALLIGAKPRFGTPWLRAVERVQKRQQQGKWDETSISSVQLSPLSQTPHPRITVTGAESGR